MSLQLATRPEKDTYEQNPYEVVRRYVPEKTPLYFAGEDSHGNRCYAKDETNNPTGAYKWRGSAVKLNSLYGGRPFSVVTASAGNHGQGVAWVAGQMGGSANVFVPIGTPQSKLDGLARLGANVYEVGSSFDEATQLAKQYAENNDTDFIHPFDDEQVMTGQGTIADEIFEQFGGSPNVFEYTVVFVPVGGGGLIGGVSERLKHLTSSLVRIVGVQVAGSDSAARSFATSLGCQVESGDGYSKIYNKQQNFGRVVQLEASCPNDDVDGTRVKMVGSRCIGNILEYVDEFIVLDPAEIGQYYINNPGSVLEPAGALAEVGVSKYGAMVGRGGLNLVSVQTGRNQDPARIEHLKSLVR